MLKQTFKVKNITLIKKIYIEINLNVIEKIRSGFIFIYLKNFIQSYPKFETMILKFKFKNFLKFVILII